LAEARGSLLIAAISGRSLACAAADAGYIPLVADFFADCDTQEIAHTAHKLQGDIGLGMQWPNLRTAFEGLSKQAPTPILGAITGSGFEDRPDLLTHIAKDWPLIGNDAETVAQINDPKRFFERLDDLAISYPETCLQRPPDPDGWVAKRPGGAGGSHVRPVRHAQPIGNHASTGELYYQTLVPGRMISALFVANGTDVQVLGFSEQWTAPAPGKPWRYGGAAQPASLPPNAAVAMAETVALLVDAFKLKGLGSADFVFNGDEPLLLEINARPGGTLDIFANAGNPLLELHVEAALNGALPDEPLVLEGGSASAIVFTREPLVVAPAMVWPSWTADRPKPGERIDKERPICTVLARAGSAEKARRLVQTRHTNLLAELRGFADELGAQEEHSENCEGTNEQAEPKCTGRTFGA